MSLEAVKLAATVQFTINKDVSGYDSLSHDDAKSFSLTADTGTYSQYLTKRYTVAGAASQTVDLTSFTDDFFGTAGAMTGVIGIMVLPTVTSGSCKIEPGDSNALTWFFSGTTPAITVPSGGCFFFAQLTSQTVDATHKTLKFTNTHGSNSMTLDLVIIGKP
jgi:hypothetical protein